MNDDDYKRKQQEAAKREQQKMDQYNMDMRKRGEQRAEQSRKERQRTYDAYQGKRCFVGGTPILTPDGWRPISELRKGDKVVSYDKSSGTTRIRDIKARRDHKRALIWEIHLTERDQPICTTDSHSFLSNHGWRRTNQLSPGDILITVENEKAVVKSVVETDRTEPVFNLITEGEHIYIAQGCVAHNFTYFRRIRMLWHRYVSRDWSIRSRRQRTRLDTAPVNLINQT